MAESVDSPEFLNNFWEMFGNDSEYTQIECDAVTNVVNDVLDTYGIRGDATTNLAGNLHALDIKRMDALTVINLALIEGSIDAGYILEWIVNADGELEVIKVGENTAFINDLYYEIQSGSYKESCVGVLLTGAKPVIEPKDLIWKYIWGDDDGKHVYDTTSIITNCAIKDFSTNAIIVYNDPHITSSYEDGISNFYEIDTQNPWDKIIGYARAISIPGYTEEQLIDTEVKELSSSVVPIIVTPEEGSNSPDIGELFTRPSAPDDPTTETDDNCWTSQPGEGVQKDDYKKGVKIPLPNDLTYEDYRNNKLSKFVRVEAVYVVGRKFTFLQSLPKTPEYARQIPTAENSDLVGAIDDIVIGTYKLEEGEHYIIAFSEEPEDDHIKRNPYILFAKNSRPNEPHAFGQNQKYYLLPSCQLAQTNFGVGPHTGTILPVAQNKGFLVEQIIAMVHLDTPSLTVYDPEWNDEELGVRTKAIEMAHALEYKMAAIVMKEPPAPMAFCDSHGAEIVDQVPTKIDTDPTTKQNFEDTPIEAIMDKMANGNGISLTLSFIEDEEDLKDLSEIIYRYMDSSEDGIETTYICGPNAEPELGAVGSNGGIINSINYSYTDSGSYTISVNEGPWMIGNLTSVSTTTNIKATETVSARGTIVDTLGNNLFFKVRIDGYGTRLAMNTAATILRVGDVVSCTIHNNPVEV